MKLIDEKVLSLRIRGIGAKLAVWRDDVTDVLVACSYQACRGNPNFANELLGVITDGKASAINISCITRYLELFAPLRVVKERFEINKGARKTMGVESEADFERFEVEMRKVSWWLIGKAQKAESIFDAAKVIEDTFSRLSKKLNDEGEPALANEVSSLVKMLYSTKAWKEVTAANVTPEAPKAPEPPKVVEIDPKAAKAKAAATATAAKLAAATLSIAAESAAAGEKLLAAM